MGQSNDHLAEALALQQADEGFRPVLQTKDDVLENRDDALPVQHTPTGPTGAGRRVCAHAGSRPIDCRGWSSAQPSMTAVCTRLRSAMWVTARTRNSSVATLHPLNLLAEPVPCATAAQVERKVGDCANRERSLWPSLTFSPLQANVKFQGRPVARWENRDGLRWVG